jgi:hypothetical protein
LAVSVTINNKTFNIPSPGEDPGWGEEVTDWIVEANKVIGSLFGPGDILETTANLADNQSIAATVVGLAFDSGVLRSAKVEYAINRVDIFETGTISLIYDQDAADWLMSQESTSDAGVSFSVTSTGQLQYTSSSTGNTGTIKFTAEGLSQ